MCVCVCVCTADPIEACLKINKSIQTFSRIASLYHNCKVLSLSLYCNRVYVAILSLYRNSEFISQF